MAAENVHEGGGISYSTWYLLLYVLGNGSQDIGLLRKLSFVLLMVAVALKVLGCYAYAVWRNLPRAWATGVALLMLVAMPLINPGRPRMIYLGQITATLWHNSTYIYVLPLVLAMFVAAVHLVRVPTPASAAVFGGIAVVSTAAKPNYSLALLPVVGIALLVVSLRRRLRPTRLLCSVGLAFGPVVALLCFQYLVVLSSSGVRGTHLVLAPLVDAQYGSASFVPVTRPTELEVRVSTTGLLIREQVR